MNVYLDHAATTPMTASARTAYLDALGTVGNPSSIHGHGQEAKRRLEDARAGIAEALGCEPIEVVLTSGGTESINLAVKGLYWHRREADPIRRRILVARGEHHATIDTVEWLAEHDDAVLEWLPLDEEGALDAAAYAAALAAPEDIALVSVLWANNEVGAVQDVVGISRLAALAGVPVHLDAVSAFGHVPVDVSAVRAASGSGGGAGLVAVSVSAHKIGGPVGVGALVLGRDAAVVPLQHGGGQQRNVRSGTQDVAGAVSFAVAAVESIDALEAEDARLSRLRDRLVTGILDAVPSASLNGPAIDSGRRLPGNAHLSFPGAQGDSLLFLLDLAGVSVSTGSACTAGIPEPSHVLLAMGRDEEAARGVLRFSLGRGSTDADVDALLAAIGDAYERASRAGLSNRSVSNDRR